MSLPPHYLAMGRGIVDAVAPQSLDDARRFGPEGARQRALQALDAALAGIPPGQRKTLACVEGCSFCCHRQVAVGAAEVFGLLEHLRATLDATAFAEFSARCVDTATLVAKMPPGQRALRSIACPVLDAGACSGYAARPFRCRAYNSLDVEPCRQFFSAPRENDPGPPADLDRFVVAQAVMFGLFAGLEHAGFDPRHYELATALADALTDAEAPLRYRRGEQAFLRAIVFG
jgi:Fe-S-cluster containining protein